MHFLGYIQRFAVFCFQLPLLNHGKVGVFEVFGVCLRFGVRFILKYAKNTGIRFQNNAFLYCQPNQADIIKLVNRSSFIAYR